MTCSSIPKQTGSPYLPIVFCGLLLAGAVLGKGSSPSQKRCTPVSEVLNSTARISSFTEAVVQLGLLDLLEDPRFKATIFAPVNEAWQTLPEKLGLPDEVTVFADSRTLATVLYHIVPLKIKVKRDARDAAVQLPTLLEQKITVGGHRNGAESRRENSTVVEGATPDNTVNTGPIRKACRSSIVEVDGLLLPDFDQDSASAWQTWELVDEWKMLLNRVDAIRQAEQAERGPANHAPAGHGSAVSHGHLHSSHKGQSRKKGQASRFSLSAKVLALFGVQDRRRHGQVTRLDNEHALKSRKQMRRWPFLDKLDAGVLLRAVHSSLTSFVRRGPKPDNLPPQPPSPSKGPAALSRDHGHGSRAKGPSAPRDPHESRRRGHGRPIAAADVASSPASGGPGLRGSLSDGKLGDAPAASPEMVPGSLVPLGTRHGDPSQTPVMQAASTGGSQE